MEHQLAQVNIARLRAPLDSTELADFVALLDPVNASADAAPGFVWRLQTESGNATDVVAFVRHLRRLGPTPYAFRLRHGFDASGAAVQRDDRQVTER